MKRIAVVFTLFILFVSCSNNKDSVDLLSGRWQSQNPSGSIYPILTFTDGTLSYQLSESVTNMGTYKGNSSELEITLERNPGKRYLYNIELKDNNLRLIGKGDFLIGDPSKVFILVR